MSLIWLPIKAGRFALARSRLISLLKGETAKSIFSRAENDGEYAKCISLFSETELGSLNVLSGVPISSQPLWTENVYHLIVGYIAQAARRSEVERGIDFINTVITSMGGTLRKHNEFHRHAIESMIFDAAIGFAYATTFDDHLAVKAWFMSAEKRYREMSHVFRLAKCTLRYSCVLAKLEMYTESRTVISTAIENLANVCQNPIAHVLKINRSLLRSITGEQEAAEIEMREIARISRIDSKLRSVTSLAENFKTLISKARKAPN